jgi:hypothetical protein
MSDPQPKMTGLHSILSLLKEMDQPAQPGNIVEKRKIYDYQIRITVYDTGDGNHMMRVIAGSDNPNVPMPPGEQIIVDMFRITTDLIERSMKNDGL